jgi:hypothetical protein
MPTRDEITAAIHAATGNPASGPIHEWTPAIIEAVNDLCNGGPSTPETNTAQKKDRELRLMGGPENTRG